jgi:hypothetical protein
MKRNFSPPPSLVFFLLFPKKRKAFLALLLRLCGEGDGNLFIYIEIDCQLMSEEGAKEINLIDQKEHDSASVMGKREASGERKVLFSTINLNKPSIAQPVDRMNI